ncbi:MAG: hypothetical protein ACK417_06610 [Bacteroidia bacterium]
MKTQETLDKLLKNRLESVEMAPPPQLFDRVLEQLDGQPKQLKPVWYRRPALMRVAAAISLLSVSATVVLNHVYRDELQRAVAADSQDSLQQQLRDDRLRDLQAVAMYNEENETLQIVKEEMQPKQPTARLGDMTIHLASETFQRESIDITTMPLRQKSNIGGSQFSKAVKGFKEVPALPQAELQLAEAPNMGQEGRFSALRRSYSQLSDGKMFELAKERIEDFTSRDHYVSFNLGRYEIGQTIPLSRLRSNEESLEE